ncbi:MAG: dockerin type I repeat-containing protein [Planctomycetes bacterium]|nr:dockerin type I repeat-containing protein [Planctomycetota bacterium]
MRHTRNHAAACLVFFPAWISSFALAGGGESFGDIPMIWSDVAVGAMSGAQHGMPQEERLAWYSLVQAPEASWLRLEFGEGSTLARAMSGAQTDSYIRITSLLDGAEQILTAESLEQWHNTSAYFNGDAVIVELITGKGDALSQISIATAQVGEEPVVIMKSQCGGVDDRIASTDPRVCRITSVGCTGWMINDANHMFLSAGHCPADPGFSVAQFHVPLSLGNGSVVNPPPEDQYAIDASSIQYANGGIGNDWCYFGVFPNSNTGLTPFQKQQASFICAAPPPVADVTLRITGFGLDIGNASQTNQTSTGPFTNNPGTTLQYAVDTMGGNSGSPVIVEGQGVAIGIHTHAGCSFGGGANNGTSYSRAGLQAALASPKGVCKAMGFDFPNGLPVNLNSAGGEEILVTFTSPSGASAPAAPKMMWKYEGDAASSTINGVLVSGTTYSFTTPGFNCGSRVLYGFSARMGASGGMGTWPAAMPQQWLSADTSSINLVMWADNFESNLSWTADASGATSGLWTRAAPNGGGFHGDPLIDADGSGECFVTGNIEGNSVADGSVTLTSPALDASTALNAHLSYSFWFDNTTGANPNQGSMVIEISEDDGQNWANVETVSPADTGVGWVHRLLHVSDFVNPSSTLRLRFTATNTDPDCVVEAGVDGVRLLAEGGLGWCGLQGDFNNDGVVDSGDLGILLLQYEIGGLTDLDGDGTTDSADVGLLLLMFS